MIGVARRAGRSAQREAASTSTSRRAVTRGAPTRSTRSTTTTTAMPTSSSCSIGATTRGNVVDERDRRLCIEVWATRRAVAASRRSAPSGPDLLLMDRRELLAAERGTLFKEAETRIALVYPSPYRAAMSSLGYQQIYRTLHAMPGVAADRAMLPDEDDDGRFETLETGQPGRQLPDARVLGRVRARDRRRRRDARAREHPGARATSATTATRSSSPAGRSRSRTRPRSRRSAT